MSVAYFPTPLVFVSASALAIACLRSGVSSRPDLALKTTWRIAPLRVWNFAFSRSVAFWASEPGITNLFSSVPLSGPKARNRITMNVNRPPNTVRFGCDACERAIRASSPVWVRDSHSAGVMSVIRSLPALQPLQRERFPFACP